MNRGCKKRMFAALAAAMMAGGCRMVSDSSVLARVNGEAITFKDYKAQYMKWPAQFRAQNKSPGFRRGLLESLVDVKVIASAARKEGFDRSAEYQSALQGAAPTDESLASNYMRTMYSGAWKPEKSEIASYYRQHQVQFGRRPLTVSEPAVVRELLGRKFSEWRVRERAAAKIEIDEKLLNSVPLPQ